MGSNRTLEVEQQACSLLCNLTFYYIRWIWWVLWRNLIISLVYSTLLTFSRWLTHFVSRPIENLRPWTEGGTTSDVVLNIVPAAIMLNVVPYLIISIKSHTNYCTHMDSNIFRRGTSEHWSWLIITWILSQIFLALRKFIISSIFMQLFLIQLRNLYFWMISVSNAHLKPQTIWC